MAGPTDRASPGAADDERNVGAPRTGLLPSQEIRAMAAAGEILGAPAITEAQIQPASLDLRLGDFAYRVRASFLPGPNATVMQRIERFGMQRVDLRGGAVLERGCVYVAPLLEAVALKARIAGIANPKSSIGRLDVFTRLITDHGAVFDQVAPGYKGPLFAEISPRTFSVVAKSGISLNQLRFQRGAPPVSDAAIRRLHRSVRLVDAGEGEADIDNGIAVTVDLQGSGDGPIGWRARHHSDLVDLSRIAAYEIADFWEPVTADRSGALILNPGDFYILASKESVTVPNDHAAEMRPYDTRIGEFRVHYAGFFDPGFGCAETDGTGSRAVLEIRSFEVPFALRDGQLVARLVYERMAAAPDKLYGPAIGSSYQRQGLMLAKHFKRV